MKSETKTILNSTLNYLGQTVARAQAALARGQRSELSLLADDIFSEAEKLVEQIDDHFKITGK